jgi:hypothetical protein
MVTNNSTNIASQGTVYYNGTGTFSGVDGSTAGKVLTSNGTGVAPSFQASSASGAVTTIDGDSGSASPSAGVITFNANTNCGSSVLFSASGSTVDLKVTDSHTNTIIGSSSGNSSISGTENVILSSSAGSVLSSGNYNTFLNSGSGISSGIGNTGIGYSSIPSVTTSNYNTSVGYGAGGQLITGAYNSFLGYEAGDGYTGAESSNICIGNRGTVSESNVIRIGTAGSGNNQQNACYIAGIEGVSVSNLNIVTINTSTGQLGSQAASNVGTVTQYDVLVGGASGAIASVGPGTSGQILQSGGNAANPAYTTATYPSTTTANQLLYSSATNTVGGLTSGNSLLAATNASGTLAMRALSVNIQTFTSSGTYTPTTGMLYCIIECVGGGGGGAGAVATNGFYISTGGGGAGSYARKFASASTIGSSQTVTIGVLGSAGGSGNHNGGNGGDTSVGSICIGKGGTGGSSAASGPANGGAGGVAGTGDVTIVGQSGGAGFQGGSSTVTGISAYGGNSYFGGGAPTQFANLAAVTGLAAIGYGGGGGSGITYTTSSAGGGAGVAGYVTITEYIIN